MTEAAMDPVLDINVGGVVYTTTRSTLTKAAKSRLGKWFARAPAESPLPRDEQHRLFIDRDGKLFRFVLDSLRAYNPEVPVDRKGGSSLTLPDGFNEWRRLHVELEFYGLADTVSHQRLRHIGAAFPKGFRASNMSNSDSHDGYMTIGYHGTFSFGRQGMANDVNFRKISRILVCGRVSVCRAVFADALNEGRDPDRGEYEDRYTARFYLKHTFLEQAFDACALHGFRMVACTGTGTNGPSIETKGVAAAATEEDRWAHYNEFVFSRP